MKKDETDPKTRLIIQIPEKLNHYATMMVRQDRVIDYSDEDTSFAFNLALKWKFHGTWQLRQNNPMVFLEKFICI